MALNVVLSSASANAAPVPAVPANPANIANANSQVNGSATLLDGTKLQQIDPVKQVVRNFEYLGNIKYDGTLVNAGEQVADNVYYCDFPGERMVKQVSFEVNGNPLDDYGTFSYVFHRQFKLKQDKRIGYFRNVGQELPVEGKSVMVGDGLRYGGQLFKGLQTPKQTQPEFQIWQKLLFWFNCDPSNAIPSAAIPYGQRYIKVLLEEVAKLLFRAPALYTILKVTNQYRPGTNFVLNGDQTYNLSGGNLATLRNTWYTYHYLPVYTGGQLNVPTIKSI